MRDNIAQLTSSTRAMIQRRQFSDERLDDFCAYCGGHPDTRDHVPPRVFLDEPFPENLMGVPSCLKCNEGASKDEEYAACFIECMIAGTTEIDLIEREKIKKILERKPRLRAMIQRDLESPKDSNEHQVWSQRMWRVFIKIAQGHARFENSEHELDPPVALKWEFLGAMSDDEVQAFVSPLPFDLWPEVGSRAMISFLNEPTSFWTSVQDGNYAYATRFGSERTVRLILRECFAVEVVWAN